jgi:hypothetical protein
MGAPPIAWGVSGALDHQNHNSVERRQIPVTIKKLTAIAALLAATGVMLAGCSSGQSAEPFGEAGSGWTDTGPDLDRPIDEQAYLDTLAVGDIEYSTEDAAITAGEAVCTFLRAGGTGLEAIDVTLENTTYSAYEAGYIVGAAQGALCPEMVGS